MSFLESVISQLMSEQSCSRTQAVNILTTKGIDFLECKQKSYQRNKVTLSSLSK